MPNPVEIYDGLQVRMREARRRHRKYNAVRAALVTELAALDQQQTDDIAALKSDAVKMRTRLSASSGKITPEKVVAYVNTWKKVNAIETATLTDSLVKFAEGL